MSSALDTTDKAVEKLKDDKLYYGDYGKQYLSNSDNKDSYIYKYTHCEIHPSTIFGILASCIPFLMHESHPVKFFTNDEECLG